MHWIVQGIIVGTCVVMIGLGLQIREYVAHIEWYGGTIVLLMQDVAKDMKK